MHHFEREMNSRHSGNCSSNRRTLARARRWAHLVGTAAPTTAAANVSSGMEFRVASRTAAEAASETAAVR
jgi:hypothetical protein